MIPNEEPAIQSLASTLEERERLLREREEELVRLRQEHLTLTEKLWLAETELLAARDETKRRVEDSMVDGEPPAPRYRLTQVSRLSADLCPFLASYANRNVRFNRASAEHVCYAIGHAHWAYGPADMEAQKSVCTRKSVYPRCPRYRHAITPGAATHQLRDKNKKGWWQFWRGDV